MQLINPTNRAPYIANLVEEIRQKSIDDSLLFPNAAARIALQWLGYYLEDDNFIDGKDRGIDAWIATNSGMEIFQVKTHEPNLDDSLDLSSFNGEGIRDLERAKNLLLHEQD